MSQSAPGSANTQPPAPPLVFGSAIFATLPGRLFLLTSAALVLLLGLRTFITLWPFFDVLRRVVWAGWFIGGAWLVVLTISRNRRAFLWRVRRKLLLSYVFLGVVPVVLVLAFTLAAGVLLYMTVASYVFQDAFSDALEDVRQIAETSAIEIGRTPSLAGLSLERRVQNLSVAYPALSLALVPVLSDGPSRPVEVITAGAWSHAPPPVSSPAWLAPGRGFLGTIVVTASNGTDPELVLRAAVPTASRSYLVVADLPVDAEFLTNLRERTGTSIGAMVTSGCDVNGQTSRPAGTTDTWTLFQETVAFLDCARWGAETTGRVSVTLVAPVAGLYDRLASVNSSQASSPLGPRWAVLVNLLLLLGGLFLIIQGSALVMGGLLARSITWAVHELFEGTERVQQGDFAHRIRIESRDQLGDLATSFNRMSASIEHLLHVQREKQRLDDELRIAREIQRSLLPVRPPVVAGIEIADLCEPAREVGGDYYDFFEVGPRQLGVLIADVSGKGTSAALYMAELKGLMLALSHTSPSPRQLLIDVNKRLSEHLDNRSFITMTYVVIDLERRTLTAARAGHTPLIVVSGGDGELITPDGMVLGLRLPGAGERFEAILVEHTQPIADGDVIALYTDGITEAMDSAGEMFGDSALVRVLASQHTLGAPALRERVLREVRAFVGDAEPHDDMTMVILKIGASTA